MLWGTGMGVSTAVWVALAIVVFVAMAEVMRRRLRVDPDTSRKFVHLATGALVFFAPFFFETATAPAVISFLFVFFLFFALRRGLLPGVQGSGENRFGPLYFGLAFFILTILCWDTNLVALMVGMQVLTWGDGMAAIIGGRYGRHTFSILKGTKTLEGTAAMFIASFLATAGTLAFFGAASTPMILWMALVVALLATAVELATPAGLDNLTIAFAAAFFTYFMLNAGLLENAVLGIGVLMSLLVAVAGYRSRVLDLSGCAAALILGTVIFGVGGWRWTIPILVFFLSATLIGRLGRDKRAGIESVVAKEGARDVYQSMANGGVAMAIILLWYFTEDARLYYIFLGTLAAVTADTWSSEIGVLSKRPPVSMTTGKPVPRGLSGGVTRLGFVAGVIGSLLVVSTGLFFDPHLSIGNDLFYVILAAGFIGTISDSFLGATVQGIFRCPSCENLTERRIHCGEHETVLHSGSRYVNNDLVNVMCGFSGGLFVYVALAVVQ